MNIFTERFSIRPVTVADQTAVLEVYRQCEDFLALGPVSQASAEMVACDLQLSHEQGGIFCGIFDPAGQMIGVVDVIPHLYQGDPSLAFLELLMIARPYRSQGIGAGVVNVVEEVIRSGENVTTILAGVQVNNPGAIRFWGRMGYRMTSGPTLMPDQTTAYALRKDFSDRG